MWNSSLKLTHSTFIFVCLICKKNLYTICCFRFVLSQYPSNFIATFQKQNILILKNKSVPFFNRFTPTDSLSLFNNILYHVMSQLFLINWLKLNVWWPQCLFVYLCSFEKDINSNKIKNTHMLAIKTINNNLSNHWTDFASKKYWK